MEHFTAHRLRFACQVAEPMRLGVFRRERSSPLLPCQLL